MIIKNWKKFVRAIVLIVSIAIGINFLVCSSAFSRQELKYKKAVVVQGDTLWNIAEKEQRSNGYYKGQDIRDIIEDIKSINKLSNANLKLGQTLEIATY